MGSYYGYRREAYAMHLYREQVKRVMHEQHVELIEAVRIVEAPSEYEGQYSPMHKKFMVVSMYSMRGIRRCDIFESDDYERAELVFDALVSARQVNSQFRAVYLWRKDIVHSRSAKTFSGGRIIDWQPSAADLLRAHVPSIGLSI